MEPICHPSLNPYKMVKVCKRIVTFLGRVKQKKRAGRASGVTGLFPLQLIREYLKTGPIVFGDNGFELHQAGQ